MPCVTVTSTVFSPSVHVAAVPLVCVTPLTFITILASALIAAAVMVLVALVVVAVYSYTELLKLGERVSAPIASDDRDALKGLRYQTQRIERLSVPHWRCSQ